MSKVVIVMPEYGIGRAADEADGDRSHGDKEKTENVNKRMVKKFIGRPGKSQRVKITAIDPRISQAMRDIPIRSLRDSCGALKPPRSSLTLTWIGLIKQRRDAKEAQDAADRDGPCGDIADVKAPDFPGRKGRNRRMGWKDLCIPEAEHFDQRDDHPPCHDSAGKHHVAILGPII